MVDKIAKEMTSPVEKGKLYLGAMTLVTFVVFAMVGMIWDNFIKKPTENAKAITDLKATQLVQQECINNMSKSVEEIKIDVKQLLRENK